MEPLHRPTDHPPRVAAAFNVLQVEKGGRSHSPRHHRAPLSPTFDLEGTANSLHFQPGQRLDPRTKCLLVAPGAGHAIKFGDDEAVTLPDELHSQGPPAF